MLFKDARNECLLMLKKKLISIFFYFLRDICYIKTTTDLEINTESLARRFRYSKHSLPLLKKIAVANAKMHAKRYSHQR